MYTISSIYLPSNTFRVKLRYPKEFIVIICFIYHVFIYVSASLHVTTSPIIFLWFYTLIYFFSAWEGHVPYIYHFRRGNGNMQYMVNSQMDFYVNSSWCCIMICAICFWIDALYDVDEWNCSILLARQCMIDLQTYIDI